MDPSESLLVVLQHIVLLPGVQLQSLTLPYFPQSIDASRLLRTLPRLAALRSLDMQNDLDGGTVLTTIRSIPTLQHATLRYIDSWPGPFQSLQYRLPSSLVSLRIISCSGFPFVYLPESSLTLQTLEYQCHFNEPMALPGSIITLAASSINLRHLVLVHPRSNPLEPLPDPNQPLLPFHTASSKHLQSIHLGGCFATNSVLNVLPSFGHKLNLQKTTMSPMQVTSSLFENGLPFAMQQLDLSFSDKAIPAERDMVAFEVRLYLSGCVLLRLTLII